MFVWLVDTSPLAQRLLEGRPTTVIEDGHVVQGALRTLGLRTLVLTLRPDEQSSTKADIAALERRLQHIEAMLSAQR
jgi:uncharacterized membrane protein YcaP (DUF421 family)